MLEMPSSSLEPWTVHLSVCYNNISDAALAGVLLLKASGLCKVVLPLQRYDTALCCSLPSPSNRAHAGHGRRECLFSTDKWPLGEQSPLFHTVVDANNHVHDRAQVNCTSDMVFHDDQGVRFHLVKCDVCPTLSQRCLARSATQKHEDFNTYDDFF